MADAPVHLLPRIEPARAGDGHHHLVCRRCGRTENVECALGERPCLEPADGHGFVIDEAEAVFWGLCPGCQAARAPRITT